MSKQFKGCAYRFVRSNGDTVSLGVCRFLDRKRPCLYMESSTGVWPLAYFKSDESAESFLGLLSEIWNASAISKNRNGNNNRKECVQKAKAAIDKAKGKVRNEGD